MAINCLSKIVLNLTILWAYGIFILVTGGLLIITYGVILHFKFWYATSDSENTFVINSMASVIETNNHHLENAWRTELQQKIKYSKESRTNRK
jgi:hypothetical protein